MKWEASIKGPKPKRFIIEQQILRNLTDQKDEYGFYLYVYDGITGFNTHDYLQDTLEIAKEQAFEEFGVPLDSWKQVE
jgi:hypothetical protein